MKIARILFPIQALGPGNRLCIWVCGCSRSCPHCANPELQYADPAREIDMPSLLRLLEPLLAEADGVTITGGEPFDQCEELSLLLDSALRHTQDILVFTGYTLKALADRQDAATDRVLRRIAVLIDGEYVDELNQGDPLRGSSNQCIHYLRPEVMPAYERYLQQGRRVQNVATASGVFSIGIHDRGFLSALQARLSTQQQSSCE